ncbi:hypothetical protein ACFQX6_27245 [Streptosporangium lutulentum]
MSTGSARPLEDAYRISQHDLVTWSAELTGLETLDAYQLISQIGEAPVGNVCDSNYTMVAKVPKTYLGYPTSTSRPTSGCAPSAGGIWPNADGRRSPRGEPSHSTPHRGRVARDGSPRDRRSQSP